MGFDMMPLMMTLNPFFFRQKTQILHTIFEMITDPDLFTHLRHEADPDDSDPTFEPDPTVLHNIFQQYA